MTVSDSMETGLSLFQRFWDAWYYFVAVLVGFFMILWGIFFNGWDWLLIGTGVATSLVCGWYTYRVLARKDSG
jgi:vacuolar-type H+-ATPase subunit I/STV1